MPSKTEIEDRRLAGLSRTRSESDPVAEQPHRSTASRTQAKTEGLCDATLFRTSADPDEAPEQYRDSGSDVDDPYVATANYMASAFTDRSPESNEDAHEEVEGKAERRRPRPR